MREEETRGRRLALSPRLLVTHQWRERRQSMSCLFFIPFLFVTSKGEKNNETPSKTNERLTLRRTLSANASSLDLFSALPTCLTSAVGTSLTTRGFEVVENALPAGGAACVRAELAALRSASLLTLNSTHLVATGGARTLLQKHGVGKAEPRVGGPAASVAPALAAAARDAMLATMASVAAPSPDVAGPAFLKAHPNAGRGGCPHHPL